MRKSVYTAGRFLELEEALLAEVRRIRNSDPFGRINILAGSNLLARYLSRKISSAYGGSMNIAALTFPDLVRETVSAAGGGWMEPLGAAAHHAIMEELSSRTAAGDFSEAFRLEGFKDALLATFTDLAEGCCHGDEASSLTEASKGAGCDRRFGELSPLYIRFRESVERAGGDLHSRFREAIAAAPAGFAGSPFLVYGFYDFNEEQWRLVEKISGNAETVFFVPWSRSRGHRFGGRLVSLLQGVGAGRIELPGNPGALAGDFKVALTSAPGVEEEYRHVARTILRLACGSGANLSDMAVVIQSEEEWQRASEVFDEAGIPCFARIGGGAQPRGAAWGVSRLASLISGGIERGALADFLVSSPLRPGPQGAFGIDPFAAWVRRSAEAGSTGEGGWAEENRLLGKRLAARAAGKAEYGAVSGRGPRAAQGGAGEAEAVFHACEIIARIEEAKPEAGEICSWEEMARRFSSLVSEIFEETEETAAAVASISTLASLDSVAAEASWKSFCSVLSKSLPVHEEARGTFGFGGVSVLLPSQARGLTYDFVFLPGLTEDALPGQARQDPFLRDEMRAAIESASGGRVRLSMRGRRIEEKALLFTLAAGSARRGLYCSWPRSAAGSGEARTRTPFLSYIEGFSEAEGHKPWIRSERIPGAADRGLEFPILGGGEYDAWHSRERGGKGSPLLGKRFFSRGARAVGARWGSRSFTAYDGVFDSARALAELAAMLDEKNWSFSATSLETWAGCPFSYFCSRVLGIESIEEPGRALTITPLQRGTIVHSILEKCFRELGRSGLLPLSHRVLDQALARAGETALAMLEELPGNEPVGLEIFWKMEKDRILGSVLSFIREEASEGEEYLPERFEESFGDVRCAVDSEFGPALRKISFHGRIDRVDRHPSGGFRVIDYKTGKLDSKAKEMSGGRFLQLPVYLLAASSILGIPVEKGIAEYRKVFRGPGPARVGFSGADWESGKERFAAILETITGGIARGVFFAPSGKRGCEHCDVRAACPPSRDRLFDMKSAADERAAGFLSLGAEEEEQDE